MRAIGWNGAWAILAQLQAWKPVVGTLGLDESANREQLKKFSTFEDVKEKDSKPMVLQYLVLIVQVSSVAQRKMLKLVFCE